jgi:preprotein translocase subunit YajC
MFFFKCALILVAIVVVFYSLEVVIIFLNNRKVMRARKEYLETLQWHNMNFDSKTCYIIVHDTIQ